jgi:hypothetical protein
VDKISINPCEQIVNQISPAMDVPNSVYSRPRRQRRAVAADLQISNARRHPQLLPVTTRCIPQPSKTKPYHKPRSTDLQSGAFGWRLSEQTVTNL